ncbi:unnamed protein product, partial [marine sediment metagenome]
KRMHTLAYGMGNQVGEEIKSERSKILRSIGDRLRNSYIKNQIGELLNVVCEIIDASEIYKFSKITCF